MAIKYKVTNDPFNQKNYPDLVGQILDNPPAYAKVELIKDLPPMDDIYKSQSNWIGDSFGETKLDDFVIKCLRAGYDKPEIIEGLGKYFRQAEDAAQSIFTKAVVKMKNIKPPKDASRNSWYKKAQFTEVLDEGIFDRFFRKKKRKKRLGPNMDFNGILPKDEDLRYFEDALSLPEGVTLNNEERTSLTEDIKARESYDALLRKQKRIEDSERRELVELKSDWELYRRVRKDNPYVEQFLHERGRDDLIDDVAFKEYLRRASNVFNLRRYTKG